MEQQWEHVAVLGAAGKMGSGIALLLLQEIATMKGCTLTLLDTHPQGFPALQKYLREHLLRYAERNINHLRKLFHYRDDLIDNGDMITAFINESLDNIRYVTSLNECIGATMIFEAILEDLEVKSDVLSKLNQIVNPEALFFSNTSSIPIHVLQEKSHINGRLIGFHFYNPPAVQKLLEIIVPRGLKEGIFEKALEVGKRLNKTIVLSEDIAGFIGNGHFIREVKAACDQVEELKKEMTLPAAICLVNTVTQDYLIRPMGIFQLIDYVGIDVVQHIARVMTQYLKGENFTTSLVENMVKAEVKGGQNGDGSQKPGFFSYEKNQPARVYDLENLEYIPYVLSEEAKKFPLGHETWRSLSKIKERERSAKLSQYFENLLQDRSEPSKLAVHFLSRSRLIVHGLVDSEVARTIQDVDTVLQNGFYHLYSVDDVWKGKEAEK